MIASVIGTIKQQEAFVMSLCDLVNAKNVVMNSAASKLQRTIDFNKLYSLVSIVARSPFISETRSIISITTKLSIKAGHLYLKCLLCKLTL